jgi:hypothetical protein
MPTFQYRNGYNSTAAYWLPGRPYITGSTLAAGEEVRVGFPTVTKSITVIATDTDPIRVHFDTTGSTDVVAGNHFITLAEAADETAIKSMDFEVRVKDIYISAVAASSFELIAYCAQVNVSEAPTLSGSGINSP